MDKRILMICYYYPPLGDVGTRRSVSFAKYMQRFGWKPHVVSVKNPDKNFCLVGQESPPPGIPTTYTYSLFNLSALSGKVNGLLSRIANFFGKQLKTNYFYQIFCVPDIFWGWIPLTVLQCIKIIKKQSLELIYVTCTPYSSALIGLLLKRMTRRPLIVDFRDQRGIEEVELKLNKHYLPSRRRIDKWFIESVLEGADLFVVTSQEILQLYKNLFPKYQNKMVTIYNGFDVDYVKPLKSLKKFEKFTIIYTGNFYFNDISSMSFFEALNYLYTRKIFNEKTFQFLYYGGDYRRIIETSAHYNVDCMVKAYPIVAYEQALSQLRCAHLQLIRIVKPMISTKVFEGISLDVPFLATIPAGEVENIIQRYSPSSRVITEESGERVAKAILEAQDEYRIGIKPNKVEEFLDIYSRENQTLRLMKAIENNVTTPRENYAPSVKLR